MYSQITLSEVVSRSGNCEVPAPLEGDGRFEGEASGKRKADQHRWRSLINLVAIISALDLFPEEKDVEVHHMCSCSIGIHVFRTRVHGSC